MKINIIGAGLGGLASACLLSARGHDVEVFEKTEAPGGKIDEYRENGYRFDTGPSLLTMPFILEKLFKQCGTSLNEELNLQPLDPLCRYFYEDGTIFDCYQNIEQTQQEIERFAPEDSSAYADFLKYAAELYDHTKDAFLNNPLYRLGDVAAINPLDFFKIDAFHTLADRVDQRLESLYLRQFFKRFATYNGSSPYQAPATLNVISHVELTLGGYYLRGGMYKIIDALYELALKQGVMFRFGTVIENIKTNKGRVRAIETEHKQEISADAILSNSDATATYQQLLGEEQLSTLKKWQLKSVEPSCSGLVMLLGIDKTYPELKHHNVFFSENYEKEFHQIFNEKIMPEDPTIYVANTSTTDPDHAPAGHSNLFVLVNAPYLSNKWNWQNEKKLYKDKIINELEDRGLQNLKQSIKVEKCFTPHHFYRKYGSHKGSIYGTSSNGKMAAFMRPQNKSRAIDGLYLTGGSTHPGGGIPLVILSAFHATELIRRYEES